MFYLSDFAFLLFDEVLASRVVIVIVSVSDGQVVSGLLRYIYSINYEM